jgi:UDP-glucuronate decarboxylase
MEQGHSIKSDKTVLARDMVYIIERFAHLEAFEGKAIIVTGFAGFLGYYFSHFFLKVLEQGISIKSLVLLDNFMLRKPRWVSRFSNRSGKVHIYHFDIAKDNLNSLRWNHKPNFIIHMASIASPSYYRKYPVETLDANVWGLRNLLDYSRNLPLDGLLFFSSSEIYGDPPSEAIPTPEDYHGYVASIGPRACYDEAKRFGETLCHVFAETYGMPICIVRPFNNFGPGMSIDDRRAPADFARAVLQGEDILLYSDGSPTRTFCYVADAVVGYLKVLTHGKFDYFNIGADSPEISIRDFAEIYQRIGKEKIGYAGKIKVERSLEKNYLTHNPSRRCPNINKARQMLGFAPQITIEKGVGLFLTHLIEERET